MSPSSSSSSSRIMKKNMNSLVLSVGASMVLVAILSSQLASSSPIQSKQDQSMGFEPNEDNEMAAAENELASLQEPANMADGELDEAEEASGSAANNNQRQWADNSETYEPNGQDSNIDNAKVHLAPMDMATAAGHHHHGGHYGGHGGGYGVSGKMSMGAHSGHKGAFGWHAKFPVGGKGRR